MMLHFKIRLTALAIGILSLAANAQTSIGPLRHWQASIEASTYNTLDWGVELGINYRPIKYVGVKASLGLCNCRSKPMPAYLYRSRQMAR